MQELARSTALMVEQELRARMVVLQVLALSEALRANDLTAFRAEAETVLAQQFPGSNIILLRADGQQLMNTILPPGAALPVRPNLETTRQVISTGEPDVSNLYQGAVGQRPVVAIDVPVRRGDGTVAHVLSLNPRIDDFADLVARQITRPIAALRRLALFNAPPTGLREADDVVQALRAAEERRLRSKDDERRARAALVASEEKLRQSQKMEAVGQLTGGLAHDFNNLLLVIIGSLDLLLESGKGGEEVRQLAQEARGAAGRGADLTRSLLAFARRHPLRPQRVSVNDLVSGIARLLSRTLGERIEVVLDLAPDVWPAAVDPAQLEAALTNLATNARDAMPKGGRLTIATANRQLDEDYASQHAEVTPGDYAMIELSDTGVGMPAAVAARIFDPFFTTKARGEGTGLGLSMVFGFMKQSGGHINVYSEPGVGTTFRMYLPHDRHAVDAEMRRAGAAALPRSGGETVLVVEDIR